MLEDALRDPTPLALQISAMLNSRQGFHDDAIADAVRSVSLDPNDANGYVTLASVSTLAGEPEKAVELIQKAMRLNPHFPSGYLFELGLAHFTSGQYSKAADELERASTLSPEDSWPGRLLIAAYGQLDRQADVDRVMSNVRLYHFGFDSLTIKSVAFWYPFKNPEHANRLAEGLRKAGVPD
jgi:Flp pilus assembly protein TadD